MYLVKYGPVWDPNKLVYMCSRWLWSRVEKNSYRMATLSLLCEYSSGLYTYIQTLYI